MSVILPGDKKLDPEPSLTKKSLRINLNENIYGTFAEIGAGQEVARHFYRAGGASGTVAKSISAYDKNFSDQIYGKEEDKRYVTQNRLSKMLDHEMDLLEKRISRKKYPYNNRTIHSIVKVCPPRKSKSKSKGQTATCQS